MNRLEQSRWNAAQKIGRKVEKLLAAGYHVRDDEGARVVAVVWEVFDGEGLGFKYDLGVVVYFSCMSGGADAAIPIAEFRALFKDWTAVHPRHVKRL